MCLEELKNYLRIRGLKVNGRKNELVARVFSASEHDVKPIKTVVEIDPCFGPCFKTQAFLIF